MSRYYRTKKNKLIKKIHEDIMNQPDSTSRDDPRDDDMQSELKRLKEQTCSSLEETDNILNQFFPATSSASSNPFNDPAASASGQTTTSSTSFAIDRDAFSESKRNY